MDVYTYTDNNGNKQRLRVVRVSSLDELQRADHIAFPGVSGPYWHHAIVVNIDKTTDKIKVIEYSNNVKRFVKNNSSYPPTKGLAQVVTETYQFKNETVYLIKHEQCLDPDTVISRAQRRLGENEYDPLTNNCEHFATSCKVGNPSSEQADGVVNKAGKEVINAVLHMRPEEIMKVVEQCAKEVGEELVKLRMHAMAKEMTAFLATKAGQDFLNLNAWQAMAVGMAAQSATRPRQVTLFLEAIIEPLAKEFMAQSAKKAGQESLKAGMQGVAKAFATNPGLKATQDLLIAAMAKEAVAQSSTKAGQEIVKTGMQAMAKEVFAQSATKAGQEFLKTGMQGVAKAFATNPGLKATQDLLIAAMAKEAVAQSSTKAGQEIMRTGMQGVAKAFATNPGLKATQDLLIAAMAKEAVAQSSTKAGQEIVKTGMQAVAKEVVEQSATKVGEEIVKTGVHVAAKESVTKAAIKTGEEMAKSTTKEAVTQTSFKAGTGVGESPFSGVLVAGTFEAACVIYDIRKAHGDMKAGLISGQEFSKAAGKRVVTGALNVASSTAGAAIGQVLIPVPVVGGVVGSIVGGFAGSLLGNIALY